AMPLRAGYLRSRWPPDALGAVRRRARSRGAGPLRGADGRSGDRRIPGRSEARPPAAGERRVRERRPYPRRDRCPRRRRDRCPCRGPQRSRRPYHRQGLLATWHSLVRAQDATERVEPLATLGDSLALCREWVSGSGVAGRKFDVGPYEIEYVILSEVDTQGRRAGTEIFATDHLGDAVARLYERYAELLPDGPARARAAATARSVAAMEGPLDLDRSAASLDSCIESIDHRTLGTWSSRGAEAFLQNLRAWPEVAE